jgi:hypothetical protein
VSKTYITAADRRTVRERAGERCEYCLIHEDDTDLSHEIDHIIAEKHGGTTEIDNLAYACFLCNNSKGSDIASLTADGSISLFFNPRTDVWTDHFRLTEDRFVLLTQKAEATERIFGFNDAARCQERRGLQRLGRYPTSIDPSTIASDDKTETSL